MPVIVAFLFSDYFPAPSFGEGRSIPLSVHAMRWGGCGPRGDMTRPLSSRDRVSRGKMLAIRES